MEAIIYNGMIRGNPPRPKTASEATTNITSRYIPSFPFSLRWEIFSASSGILVTISTDRIIMKITRNVVEIVRESKIL